MSKTTFVDIYKMALSDIQDPHIKQVFNNNQILFCEVMNNFLNNAIPLFTSPIQVKKRLSDLKIPYEITEKYIGDGVKDKFVLSYQIPNDDLEYFIFNVQVNNENVEFNYDSNDNSINFTSPPSVNSDIVINIYFTGYFNIELYQEEKYILSQWVVVCWSEYVQNNKMDIDRLLGDTDFKLVSNATTTQSKSSWYCVNRETTTKRMNNYAWNSKILKLYE